MTNKCPRCDSSSNVTSALWAARLYAAGTEWVMGPARIVTNTIGIGLRSGMQGIKTTREVHHCGNCEVYFFECPDCYKRTALSSMPTQGKIATCQKCGEKAILRLD